MRHVARTMIGHLRVPLRANTAARWRGRPRLTFLSASGTHMAVLSPGHVPLATPTVREGPRRAHVSTDRVNQPHRRMLTGRSGHTVVFDQHPALQPGFGTRRTGTQLLRTVNNRAIGKEFAVEERDEKTAQEKVDNARAESAPGGIPEDADVGTGREKGTGLPPGSVGKGEDTQQTPAT
jgi:hypothetical protein